MYVRMWTYDDVDILNTTFVKKVDCLVCDARNIYSHPTCLSLATIITICGFNQRVTVPGRYIPVCVISYYLTLTPSIHPYVPLHKQM